MTGYGRAECQKDDYTYLAEIRSVNNRFIEISTRLPKAHMDLEQPLKKLIKSYCSRGSINLSISIGNANENTGEWEVKPNLPLAAQYVTALQQIRDSLKLEGKIDLKSIISIRDIVKIEPLATDPANHELILNIATEALDSLQKMRKEEGINLQKDLEQRIDAIENHAAEIESWHPEAVSYTHLTLPTIYSV